MRKIQLLALLLVLANALFSQQSSLYEKQLFVVGDDTLRCRILTPLNFRPGTKYPLVVFLHGAGERGDDNEKQLTWGGALFADSVNRVKYPAIVVFPQCPANAWWAPLKREEKKDSLGSFRISGDSAMMKPLQLVLQFIDTLVKAGNVDSRRIYVGGLSMGGMGTFDIIGRRPNLFAAAFPICGAGDPNVVSRYRQNLPLWVFHGSADNVVLPSNSRLLVNLMRARKMNVKYTEYPGVGHDSWKNAFAEPELMGWLFGQKR